MNSASPASASPADGASRLRVPAPLSGWAILLRLALICAVAFVAVIGLAAWTFMPRGEVRELRRVALEQLPGNWQRQVEVRVGGAICSAGQIAAACAGAPQEALAVLQCLDSAEVSVHHRKSGGAQASAEESGGLLAAVTQAMNKRGWEPLVRVRSHRDTIAVFLAPTSDREEMHLCVLVHSGDDLIVTSCRGRPGPLLQILNTPAWREKVRSWR